MNNLEFGLKVVTLRNLLLEPALTPEDTVLVGAISRALLTEVSKSVLDAPLDGLTVADMEAVAVVNLVATAAVI